MTRKQVIWLVVVLLLVFAVQAGEYSTWDWLTLRRERVEEKEQIDRLRVEVDSLEREAVAIETDPVVQERRARELFGMVRDGEIVYTIERDTLP